MCDSVGYTSTVTHQGPGGLLEVATVEYQGRAYTELGAQITDEFLVCYPKGETVGAKVTTWDGQAIGTIVRVSSRAAVWFGRRSWQGSRYYFLRIRLDDGREYACRGFGAGMVAMGRRVRAS